MKPEFKLGADIQTTRHLKIGRHKDLLIIYRRQLQQLVDLIQSRQKSIEKIETAIGIEDLKRTKAFNLKMSRAKDDASTADFSVGQRYRSGPEFFTITQGADNTIRVIRESDQHCFLAGKDLGTIAEVFFFDLPAAVLV